MSGRGERALRTRLAKRLKMVEIPENLWEQLLRDAYIELVEADPTEWPVLVRVAKERLALFHRGYRATPSEPVRVTPRGQGALPSDGYERERALAIAEYVAQKVAMLPRVRSFRAEVLGGRLLTGDEALAFLASPVTHLLSHETVARYSIPLIGHTVIPRESGALFVDPPGIDVPVPDDPRDEALVLHFVGADGRPWPVGDIRPGSILGDLILLCAFLTTSAPWDPAEIPLFVLTGQAPIIPPLVSGVQHLRTAEITRSMVTLEVDPWLPADLVAQHYRALQRMLIGGENRPLSRRNLAVFRFVVARTDEHGDRPRWADLMTEWNTTHPDDMYAEVSLFHRDYSRVRQAVTAPPYLWAGSDTADSPAALE